MLTIYPFYIWTLLGIFWIKNNTVQLDAVGQRLGDNLAFDSLGVQAQSKADPAVGCALAGGEESEIVMVRYTGFLMPLCQNFSDLGPVPNASNIFTRL